MDNVNETRQQVAHLSKALGLEARRVARWAITCLIFALATTAIVAATKSLVFFVVALFAWFFAWNRWRLWRLLIACLPPPNKNQEAWLEKTVEGLLDPPSWYTLSEHVAALTFLVGFAIITIVVTSTSGTWMRLLYVVCWLVIAFVLVIVRIAYRTQKRANSPSS